MATKRSKKSAAALAVTAVLCVAGLVGFLTQRQSLDVPKAESEIRSLLARHGFTAKASCPESELVVGEPIWCSARLDSGESLRFRLTPTSESGDARIETPDVLERDHAERAVRDRLATVDLSPTEVTCPATQIFRIGASTDCAVAFADATRATATIEHREDDMLWVDFAAVNAEPELAEAK